MGRALEVPLPDAPDQTGVPDGPDESGVVSQVPPEPPDQARGGDVEEVVRDDLVVPGHARRVQATAPDQAGRRRFARVPGAAPLAVVRVGDLTLGVQTVEV